MIKYVVIGRSSWSATIKRADSEIVWVGWLPKVCRAQFTKSNYPFVALVQRLSTPVNTHCSSLFTAMLRGKETSSCAAALLLCTVLALPTATGETENTQSARVLQCTSEVLSLVINRTKCTLPAYTQNLKCSQRPLTNILWNVSLV